MSFKISKLASMERNSSNDISLLEVAIAAYRTLRRNLMLTILIPLSGIAIAVVYHFTSSDRFQGSMLIETSLLNKQEAGFVLDQIDEVRLLPGLSDEHLSKILRLKFDVLDGNVSVKQDYRTVLIKATARVTDPRIFATLQAVVVNVIDSMDIVRVHRKERQLYYNSLISKIDEELSAMETVKTQVSGNVQATYLDPASLYEQTIELFREKANLQMQLAEISTIRVVKEFESLFSYKKLTLPVIIVLGFVCGVAILITVLFLKYMFAQMN